MIEPMLTKIYHRIWAEPRERKTNAELADKWARTLQQESKITVEESIERSLIWLRRAQLNGTNKGMGFDRAFNLRQETWELPYPETTGYIISTLIKVAPKFPELKLLDAAKQAGEWLQETQFESGAICAKQWRPGNSKPSVFNTGMVLHGLSDLPESTDGHSFYASACKAANWLVKTQDSDGAWRKHAYFGISHTYYTMVAWALIKFGLRFAKNEFVEKGVHNLEWTLKHQKANGWIEKVGFDRSNTATTHTIAYCAQGLAESGVLLNENKYVEAAGRLISPLNAAFKNHQCLPGQFNSRWKPIPMQYKNALNKKVELGPWECLTGTAQTSCTNWAIAQYLGDSAFRNIALEQNAHLQKMQLACPTNENIHGALSGSWPLNGPYDTLALPNHAAKFFVDAMMFQLS